MERHVLSLYECSFHFSLSSSPPFKSAKAGCNLAVACQISSTLFQPSGWQRLPCWKLDLLFVNVQYTSCNHDELNFAALQNLKEWNWLYFDPMFQYYLTASTDCTTSTKGWTEQIAFWKQLCSWLLHSSRALPDETGFGSRSFYVLGKPANWTAVSKMSTNSDCYNTSLNLSSAPNICNLACAQMKLPTATVVLHFCFLVLSKYIPS